VRRTSLAVLAAASVAAAGCGGADEPEAAATPVPTAAATAAAQVTRGGVDADCRRHVPANAVGTPASLLNPPAAVAVAPGAVDDGGIARLHGYVAMDPGTFLAAWRARPDVSVVDGENEGFEAEVHVQGRGTSVFWQVKKVCDTGSTFTAVVTTG
jgi:hypothetical protein